MSSNNLDDFYPAVAINALMRILKDQSLSQHHTQKWRHDLDKQEEDEHREIQYCRIINYKLMHNITF